MKWTKGTINAAGYRQVMYNGERWYEHRLVWVKHNGEIPDDHHIHRINGVKDDNRIENLELITATKHARRHAIEFGLGRDNIGVEPPNKLNNETINYIQKLRADGKLLREICDITNLSWPTVCKYTKGL